MFKTKPVVFLFLIGFFLFGFSGHASAATYYVRQDGSSTKANATSCAAAATAMSVSYLNSQSFTAGDVILFCSDGGTFSGTQVTPLSSGSAGAPPAYITYMNAPGEDVIIDGTGVTYAFYSSKS